MCGRMSRMSADSSESTVGNDEGGSEVNAVGGRAGEEAPRVDGDGMGGREREEVMSGGIGPGDRWRVGGDVGDLGADPEGLLREMREVA